MQGDLFPLPDSVAVSEIAVMPAPNKTPLVQAIQSYLERTGTSRRALSLLIGRDETFIRQLIKDGSRRINAETLERLATVMGVPMDSLSERSSSVGATRLPGRSPGPAQRAEVLRIWDSLDGDRRKAILLIARAMAKDAGLEEGDGPLLLPRTQGKDQP